MGDLAKRLAAGDEAAFAELFDACAERLLRWLRVRLWGLSDAEDVLQETFVRIARSHCRLSNVENLTAYVFQVARNEVLREAQRESREAHHQQLRLQSSDRGASLAPGQVEEIAESIGVALARLQPQQREVVELKIYGEMTFREVAEVLGLPQGTVATRYRAAMDALRQTLTKELS